MVKKIREDNDALGATESPEAKVEEPAPSKPAPKAPEAKAGKGDKRGWLKAIISAGFLIGAVASSMVNGNLVAQGYELSSFSMVLPYVLGFGALIFLMWSISAAIKARSATKTTAAKAEPMPKKTGKGGPLKIAIAVALLGGAWFAYDSTAALLEQGYTLSLFGAYLPLGLAVLGLACLLWAFAGRKRKAKNPPATSTAAPDGTVLTAVRPCNKEGCPSLIHFGGHGKCASNGVRPRHCQLSEEEFEELFSEDAYLGH